MLTRSLYELVVTNDVPVEKCKSNFLGQSCEEDALPGSIYCEGCLTGEAGSGFFLDPREHPGIQTNQCQYTNARGPDRGEQCPENAEIGINLCPKHKNYRTARLTRMPVAQILTLTVPVKVPTSYSLRFKAVKDLSSFRTSQILTDVTLMVEGTAFTAHKLILAIASPYFERLFLSGMKEGSQESVILQDVNAKTFRFYLDLIYGKELTLTDWTEAFDLFDYFNMTLLNWSKDNCLTAFWVLPEEYPRYIERLEKVCGDLTEEMIKITKKYVTKETDLSNFDADFVTLVRPPIDT